MRNLGRRLLKVLLCTALVAGLLCGLAVFAAAAETVPYYEEVEPGKVILGTKEVAEPEAPETNPVHQLPKQARTLVQDEYGEYNVTTLEELKEAMAMAGEDFIWVNYLSTEDLVIDEDLVIPAGMQVNIFNAKLVVEEGVTLTVSYDTGVDTMGLEVVGTLDVQGGCYAFNSCDITGQVLVSGSFGVNGYGSNTGLDNVQMDEFCWVYVNMYAQSLAEMMEAMDIAAADLGSRWQYCVFNYEVTEDLTIDADMTVPNNASLDLEGAGSVTIAQGCQLTIDGTAYLDLQLTVNGVLENNGNITVPMATENVITRNGTWQGNGSIWLYEITPAQLAELYPWMDSEEFRVTEDGADLYVEYVGNLIKLATPTDLVWGIDYDRNAEWDEETQQPIQIPTERAGVMSWKTARPDQAEAQIKVYRVGEEAPVAEYWWNFGVDYVPEYRSIDSFINGDAVESGTYYFTVQSMGDGVEYIDSDVAVSDTWTYVRPDKQLGTATNLTWNLPQVNWDNPADTSHYGGRFVYWYYTPSLDEEPVELGGGWNYNGDPTETVEWFDEYWVMDFGAGYYGFKVQLLSRDITLCSNGERSEMSPLFYMDEYVGPVEDQLGDLAADTENMTADEIRDNVQALDTEQLKYALAADTEDEGATAALAALEEAAGGPAEIAVSEEVSAFDPELVDIVGANLNTNTSDADPITLVIDKPEQEDVIPERYNSTLAVSFSMTLENVEDTQNLAVPVKIKLPIPETINPNFLVILHYHADGSMEEVWPSISYENGQGYASFVLTSFSDFVFTEYNMFDIAFANMTLGNSLAMNFAFPQDGWDDWSGCYAKIIKEFADGRPAREVIVPFADWGAANIGGVPHYTVKFPGVAAKEMSDSVIVYVCNAEGVALSNVWVDSVRAYAMRTLNNPNTSQQSAIMVVDLLNYGAAAQEYLGYNSGDLANNQLTAEQKALATKDAPAADGRIKGENYRGTNLGLESQILMRMAFKQAPADAYATIEFTNHSGNKVKVEVASDEILVDNGSSIVVIDEIVVADGRKPVTVTIYNADGSVFASATDSMEGYIARMREKAEDPLYEAILKFSDSAYNFFHN